MNHQTAEVSANVITQDDLRVAQIIEDMGLRIWRKVYDGMIEGMPVEPGELAIATGWVPGKPLVVEDSQAGIAIQNLHRAISYHQDRLTVLREQVAELRPESRFNLLARAAQFAKAH